MEDMLPTAKESISARSLDHGLLVQLHQSFFDTAKHNHESWPEFAGGGYWHGLGEPYVLYVSILSGKVMLTFK